MIAGGVGVFGDGLAERGVDVGEAVLADGDAQGHRVGTPEFRSWWAYERAC